jgi:putative hydrolase of the HAD superfamily
LKIVLKNNPFAKGFSLTKCFAITLPVIHAIFIDMDDTLIATTALYEKAKDAFDAYLAPYGVSRDELERVYDQAERDLFAVHGYSRARFPASFEQTLKHFIPDATPDMVAEVRAFGESVFNTPADLLPGVDKAMELLFAKYPVYLVTQGDQSVQEDRIAQLPFRDRFAGVFIIDQKSKETFETLASQLGYPPGDIAMLGDSLKSDINTSVAAGLRAYWVQGANWHMMENSDQECPPAAKQFSNLLDAARDICDGATPVSVPKRAPPRAGGHENMP